MSAPGSATRSAPPSQGGRSVSVSLPARYGKWAVVAGASEGLGAAFAEQLAERGMRLVPGRVNRLAALLFPRERDDDRRYAAKYGPLWEQYREKVPWRIVPRVC